MIPDGDWFELKIRVVENHIMIFVNGHPVVNYIEPEIPYRTANYAERILSSGTFRIESHYGHSKLNIRKLSVERLAAGGVMKYEDPEYAKQNNS